VLEFSNQSNHHRGELFKSLAPTQKRDATRRALVVNTNQIKSHRVHETKRILARTSSARCLRNNPSKASLFTPRSTSSLAYAPIPLTALIPTREALRTSLTSASNRSLFNAADARPYASRRKSVDEDDVMVRLLRSMRSTANHRRRHERVVRREDE
jgi:hypothetical protein